MSRMDIPNEPVESGCVTEQNLLLCVVKIIATQRKNISCASQLEDEISEDKNGRSVLCPCYVVYVIRSLNHDLDFVEVIHVRKCEQALISLT